MNKLRRCMCSMNINNKINKPKVCEITSKHLPMPLNTPRNILTIPNKQLFQTTLPINFNEDLTEFYQELSDAYATFQYIREHDDQPDTPAVALSAPQIGINKRFFMIGELEDEIPESAWFNAFYEPLDDRVSLEWEGCLSLDNVHGFVPRFEKILVQCHDFQGNLFEQEYEGEYARILQHEIDHLDGVLYPQRMLTLDTLKSTSQLAEDKRFRESLEFKELFYMSVVTKETGWKLYFGEETEKEMQQVLDGQKEIPDEIPESVRKYIRQVKHWRGKKKK